jgi:hypothetical protein
MEGRKERKINNQFGHFSAKTIKVIAFVMWLSPPPLSYPQLWKPDFSQTLTSYKGKPSRPLLRDF